ncbi:MAG: transglycosylase SLT domain-containing protein [Pyrinomonadaceae bacterium]
MKIFFVAALSLVLSFSTVFAQNSDAALRNATEQDSANRDASGKLPTLYAAVHLARAETYSANRLFPQAREHWQKVFDNYPGDAGMSKALFGTARSYMWERDYGKAVEWFNKLTKDYPFTKDGREGLAFKGASLVRDGKNLEAARAYEQYVTLFPKGEKIESAHLNIIDAYREAEKYAEADQWVDKTVRTFAGRPTDANARQAHLRMKIHQGDWNGAVAAADSLLTVGTFAKSMTSADEAKFLKALALEKSGKKAEANAVFASITNGINSYYGGLAAEHLAGGEYVRKTISATPRLYADYPVVYRSELLQHARSKKIDPRFLLAIMKQESVFKAGAKSPAGARGLLQFVFDTALKYKKKAGYPNLQPDDLYKPAVSIALGSVYVAELKDEFDGLYEAVAASYNGGEDNAARWLNRSKPKEAGVFAAEVGFAETKNYVFKVMNNYRVYRELYTEDLQRR